MWTVGTTFSGYWYLDACPKDKLNLAARLAPFSRTGSQHQPNFSPKRLARLFADIQNDLSGHWLFLKIFHSDIHHFRWHLDVAL